MELQPFLLEQWLEQHQAKTKYNLASSTGPPFTVEELMDFMSQEEQECLFKSQIVYSPSRGGAPLRRSIATWLGVAEDEVLIATGASEALWILFFSATEPGANVVVPSPGFPTFTALPESLGLETRTYHLRQENRFQLDLDEIQSIADEKTRIILVNTPHNPTGMTVGPAVLGRIHDFAVDRGIQLVVDEVYHPIHYGEEQPSAARLPHATVLGDLSKALCLSGLRVGWMIERDRERLEKYWNARSYFTISNTLIGEYLADIAVRHRQVIFERAKKTAEANLELLDGFFAENRDRLSWVRPGGSFTAFPRLRSDRDSRPFCARAAEAGILLAPGDCFGYPPHFRLGFGVCTGGFEEALGLLSKLLRDIA